MRGIPRPTTHARFFVVVIAAAVTAKPLRAFSLEAAVDSIVAEWISHGNWCGLGHGARDCWCSESVYSDPTCCPPITPVDEVCQWHDACYAYKEWLMKNSTVQYTNESPGWFGDCDCDREIIRGDLNMAIPKPVSFDPLSHEVEFDFDTVWRVPFHSCHDDGPLACASQYCPHSDLECQEASLLGVGFFTDISTKPCHCENGSEHHTSDAVAGRVDCGTSVFDKDVLVGNITVWVNKAKRLRYHDWIFFKDEPDAYVHVALEDGRYSDTAVVHDDQNPVWDAEVSFENVEEDMRLILEVRDRDSLFDDFLGRYELAITHNLREGVEQCKELLLGYGSLCFSVTFTASQS